MAARRGGRSGSSARGQKPAKAPAKRKSRVVEARRELYRQLILEGAERAFAERGYDDTKMEHIAGESGLSMGTVYSVFPGKAMIFAAVHEAADDELLRRGLECFDERDSALDRLLAGVRATVGYFIEHPDFLRMELNEGLAWSAETEARGGKRSHARRQGLELMKRSVTNCVEAGTFVDADPELIARMMIAMYQVQLAYWLEGGMKRPADEVVNEVTEQVKRSFCVPGALGESGAPGALAAPEA